MVGLPDYVQVHVLYDDVSSFQVHSHRNKCQKDINVRLTKEEILTLSEKEKTKLMEDKRCRYGFPKPVAEKTHLKLSQTVQDQLKTLDGIYSDEEKKLGEEIEKKKAKGAPCSDIEDKLKELKLELKRTKYNVLQSGNVEVVLQRDEPDIYVNNYVPAVTRLWKANTDVQFITNAYACIMYLVGRASHLVG